MQQHLRATFKICKRFSRSARKQLRELVLESELVIQASSEVPTPYEKLIYYEAEKIGEGTFDRVYKVVKGRYGKVFAAKIFSPPPNENKKRRDGLNTPNILQVFELQKFSEPAIIIAFYGSGSIADINIEKSKYITAWSQILNSLNHLYNRKIVHRNLKPENFLVEIELLFKVVIADFGLAKIATNSTSLQTFCSSLKYTAPEASSPWNGSTAFRKPPPGDQQSSDWANKWNKLLLDKLRDQEDGDKVIQILVHMIEIDTTSRWAASQCLAGSLKAGVLQRRMTDGLVACADDLDLTQKEGEDEKRTLS
ncbi:hypothetical protein M406DRAFT_71424 [Cryphonectria parasitica EP155]|uniref:Protein kinase domain-containing protein n=1 Tax=Cryphonectria parasitica (strain ATCC 38755 / EP155) TaxID=660469 RepID=A0A9P4Y9S6_CRYP1|nr:uncharacterized protein M406DRAFT_71424 [Cryphonectria parasitica EP155]KAF3769396.1 hypothetical protein M406DRAFT_71424 [Cryphonectria parasitica EP155]